MATINQLASRIANTLNQPTNAELIERAKDMIRSAFAVKIKDSIRKEGLRETLITSFAVNTVRVDLQHFIITGEVKTSTTKTNVAYVSEHPICVPVDIANDAPFTSVTINAGIVNYNALTTHLYRLPPLPVGVPYEYSIINQYLVLVDKLGTAGIGANDYVFISGVFEDPSEILARSSDPDNVELPIPNSIIEDMLYTIFRINFNMYPKDITINVNKDQIQQGN